jgi:hypothetical protein
MVMQVEVHLLVLMEMLVLLLLLLPVLIWCLPFFPILLLWHQLSALAPFGTIKKGGVDNY